MDAKRLAAVLLAVLLACFAFAVNCSDQGGDDVVISAGGGLRRKPDGEKMVGSSKINIVLCVKEECYGSGTCFCCQTLTNRPCYKNQSDCLRVCPKQLHRIPSHRATADVIINGPQ